MSYHKLTITAADPKREIWLADNEGNLVQRGVGVMLTSLLPGSYVVQFGCLSDNNDSPTHPINLSADTEYHEEGDP